MPPATYRPRTSLTPSLYAGRTFLEPARLVITLGYDSTTPKANKAAPPRSTQPQTFASLGVGRLTTPSSASSLSSPYTRVPAFARYQRGPPNLLSPSSVEGTTQLKGAQEPNALGVLLATRHVPLFM